MFYYVLTATFWCGPIAHNLLISYMVLILVTWKWMQPIIKVVKNDCIILYFCSGVVNWLKPIEAFSTVFSVFDPNVWSEIQSAWVKMYLGTESICLSGLLWLSLNRTVLQVSNSSWSATSVYHFCSERMQLRPWFSYKKWDFPALICPLPAPAPALPYDNMQIKKRITILKSWGNLGRVSLFPTFHPSVFLSISIFCAEAQEAFQVLSTV